MQMAFDGCLYLHFFHACICKQAADDHVTCFKNWFIKRIDMTNTYL
jgi:hypothetical protein